MTICVLFFPLVNKLEGKRKKKERERVGGRNMGKRGRKGQEEGEKENIL
jgi:hypothetical protein